MNTVKYSDLFKNEKPVYKIFTVILILFSAYFVSWVFRGLLIGLDYPKEMFEQSNINLTNAFLSGRNPYLIANMTGPGQEPPIVYVYPFLNSLIASGLAFIMGGNAVLAQYILSFAVMIGTGLLGAGIVSRYSRSTIGPTLAFIMLMFCHWRYGYTGAAPDGMGLFITMLTLYMAVRPNVKYRALWCSIGIVLTFYTKQYFAAVCVSIFLYMWFYSKKEALKLFLCCVLFTAASIAVTAAFWPLYWDYTIVLMKYSSNAVSGNSAAANGGGGSGFSYYFEQLSYLSRIFAGLYIAAAAALILRMKDRKTAAETSETKEGNADLLFGIQIPVQLLVLMYFGRHDGAYLTYFLQLLFPSVIIFSIILTERVNQNHAKNLYFCGYVLIALFSVYFGWRKLPMHLLSEDEKAVWKSAYKLMDEYREKGEIRNYYTTAFDGVKKGDSTFATGHDGHAYNKKYHERWSENKLDQKLFPHAGILFEEYAGYKEEVLKRIENGEYSLITYPADPYGYFIPKDLLIQSGYQRIDMMDLRVGNMVYTTEFWAQVED
ncbi:MAG: hypothetical protein IKX95_05405 [Lachnospiraceae bacterium]|nr:hypothetical protein [Lachnospiraceae bacterium]